MFLNLEYKNLLTKKECSEIAKEFHTLLSTKETDESCSDRSKIHIDHGYTKGSFGYYNLKKSLKFLKKIEKVVLADYNDEVVFKNSYIRKYINGNQLTAHIDKPGLDITLSVTIEGLTNWPLCVSNIVFEDPHILGAVSPKYQNNHKKYYTNIGDGVACYGRNTVHWREPLVCGPDEYLIQLFYHWTFV
jgi:hypothetical protein